MLTSQLGIRLMLLTGENVPRPASYETMNAVTQVQVNSSDETGDGFQISVSVGKGKLQDYSLLKSGEFAIFNRVIVAVVMGVMPEVLIDGVITNHQMSPSSDPGMSTMTVTGTDITRMMDLEETNVPYDNQSSSIIVGRILSNYAIYGLVQALTPTTDIQPNLEYTPWQRDTDLACIQQLARKNGFVFYIEPLTIGSNTAYWGPKIRTGAPQPALSIGMGGATNVKSLSFSEEGLSAASVKASFVEPLSKTTIQLPAVPPVRIPPLAGTPTPSKRVTILRDTANKGAAETLLSMMSAMTNQPDTVDGSGEVDSARYGHVLRPRRLVGVRGAGLAYDGLYYVKSVSHRISRGEYSQSFSLSREGTGALLPMVMT
jgi:hypothetical protein